MATEREIQRSATALIVEIVSTLRMMGWDFAMVGVYCRASDPNMAAGATFYELADDRDADALAQAGRFVDLIRDDIGHRVTRMTGMAAAPPPGPHHLPPETLKRWRTDAVNWTWPERPDRTIPSIVAGERMLALLDEIDRLWASRLPPPAVGAEPPAA